MVLELDPQRMQEVFLNLLMNAIQAVKEPPGEVKISARLDTQEQEAVITVADTGMGIPQGGVGPHLRPLLHHQRSWGGHGVGPVHRLGIIEKHHGQVSVESKLGEGTRFTIRMPYNPEAPLVERAVP